MKKKLRILLIVILLSLLSSCVTDRLGHVGSLPKEWWKETRGTIERVLRADSEGYYAKVMVFIGQSDLVSNYSATLAIRSATLDAQSQLSDFLINRVTNITVTDQNVKTIQEASQGGEEINRLVDEAIQNMRSAMTVTQFSSLIIEATHTEESSRSGVLFYKGWVCMTIQDDIVDEIQKIQKEAFDSVIKSAAAYADVMQEIQKASAEAIVDAITMDLGRRPQDSAED